MQFKVRKGFAVHHEKTITTEQAGAQVKQRVTESHFPGETFEMEEKHARQHLHKLEPADADAAKLFESIYSANREASKSRVATVLTEDEIDKRIAAGVEAGLARAMAAQQGGGKRQAPAGS